MQIQWQRNQFITFYAKIKIRVGGSPNSYTILQGDEFEFDGTVCRFSGAEFPQHSLRGAIAAGWATTEKGDITRVEPYTPGRQIASATSVNRDLSRVQHQSNPNMDVDSLDEETVIQVNDRQAAMKDGRKHLTHADNRRSNGARAARGMPIQQGAEDQEAVVVSRLATSTHRVVDVAAQPGVARELEMASYDDGVGRANDARDSQTTHREGVTIKTNLGRMQSGIHIGDENEGRVVGHVRNSQVSSVEGVSIEDTSNIRSKSKAKSAPKSVMAVKATAAPKAAPVAATGLSDKLVTAQTIYPKFPNDWNFFAKTEDKLRKVEEIGPNKALIQALLASESKSVKKLLVEKYPKLA